MMTIKFLIFITAIFFALYMVVLALMYTLQAHFIYFPDTTLDFTPKDIALAYEDVEFNSDDGQMLHGWFIPADKSKNVVLFAHGNAGNISRRLESIKLLNEIGVSVFIFDYQGYGKSKGTPSEIKTYFDILGAWNYLTQSRHVDPKNISLFGRSLGAAIAAKCAQEVEPKSLIIESGFTSLLDIARKQYFFLPVKLLLKHRYPTQAYLPNIHVPVLIIHSKDDELIPLSHGKDLFKAANQPKYFYNIRGSHNDGFLLSRQTYLEEIKRFLNLE